MRLAAGRIQRWVLALAVCAALGLALGRKVGGGELPPGQNAPQAAPAATFEQTIRPFLQEHCYQCHDARKSKAGFRIDELTADFGSPVTTDQWAEVVDRLTAGEMPPKKQPRPDARALAAVVGWLQDNLHQAELAAKGAGGRVPMRRLNRSEYANTIGDLLHLDSNETARIRDLLPADGKAEGFDRLASALFIDETQMQQYLQAADAAAALAVQTEPVPSHSAVQAMTNSLEHERPLVPVHPDLKPPHLVLNGPYRFEPYGNGMLYMQGGHMGHAPADKVVTCDGYYRIRFHGGAAVGARGTPIRVRWNFAAGTPIEVGGEFEVRATIDAPDVVEVVAYLRAPAADQKAELNFYWNGLADLIEMDPSLTHLWVRVGQTMSVLATTINSHAPQAELNAARKALDDVWGQLAAFNDPRNRYNPKYDLKAVPELYAQSVNLEGPLTLQWPPPASVAIGFSPGMPHTESAVRQMFAQFMPRAYREPVAPQEIDRIVAVVMGAMSRPHATFPAAVRRGLRAVFCSPRFLFVQVSPPAPASAAHDYVLASRLSYFLWNSGPDEQLLGLAAAGALHEPATMRAQVDRLLKDARAGRFVDDFAGQWLDARQYGSVMPAREYKDYDKALEEASRREPAAFFGEVLHGDLPIANFLNSDFLVVNERLARHYGLSGVVGDQFRRVAITPEDHRGGVLGMAGLMTLLADGNRTLPMRRGAWVLRELFNDPPRNPPANAGQLQPNAGGKRLTVRQRLELHRTQEVCASCHVKLDPFGLALENYDAIGAWRQRANGEGFGGIGAPQVDVSGVFPGGESFTTLEEYKAKLLERKDKFARAFAIKMLTYALGRPVGYTDRADVDRLVAALQNNSYRIQSLIHAIAVSDAFQSH